jgi:hypothetical protein
MTNKDLFDLPGNSVLYSEDAWAVLRKESQGTDMWITDRGSHTSYSLSSNEVLEWAADWVLILPAVGNSNERR